MNSQWKTLPFLRISAFSMTKSLQMCTLPQGLWGLAVAFCAINSTSGPAEGRGLPFHLPSRRSMNILHNRHQAGCGRPHPHPSGSHGPACLSPRSSRLPRWGDPLRLLLL